jgi:hypothetical protein
VSHVADAARLGKQPGKLNARVWRTHERFTNQKRVYIVIAHCLHVGRLQDTALGDDAFVCRNAR